MARVDTTRRSAPMMRYEFGMFNDPTGGLAARALSAELLDDRKLYHPVGPNSSDASPLMNAEGRPGVSNRKWRLIGENNAHLAPLTRA